MPEALPIPPETPIDLRDPDLWVQRFSVTWVANGTEEVFEPMPEVLLPISLTSPIIAIQTLSVTVPSFRYAGKLIQLQEIGINQAARLGYRSIYRGLQVVRFRQDLIGPYQLSFNPWSKLNRLTFNLWEFLV